MKTLYLIIIGILIAMALWLYLRPQNELKDIDVTQLTKALEDKVIRAETIQQNVIVKAKDDSLKHAVINKAKDEEIARLKRTARKFRTVHVDTILIQDNEVGAYAAMLDSIVVSQDSQISELKEQKAEQWASFNQLITASDSASQANKELSELNLEIEKSKTKKSKNKRFALGPYLGYDVIKNRPSVGVSVHFDLLRF